MEIPQPNSGWKMDKGISEGNFIKVIYDFLLSVKSEECDKIKKEEMARTALSLHKLYWEKCYADSMKKLNSEMYRDYRNKRE